MNLLEAKPLPDKLSDCLEVALADLERCEGDPGYEIRMSRWHEKRGKVCQVCLAGAAMIGLGVTKNQTRTPDDFGKHTELRLLAISDVALCTVESALHTLGKSCPSSLIQFDRPPRYADHPDSFKAYIRSAIEGLRKEGL